MKQKPTPQEIYDLIMRRTRSLEQITVDDQLDVIERWFEEEDDGEGESRSPKNA